jgi:charged multivesicular body protein 2A
MKRKGKILIKIIIVKSEMGNSQPKLTPKELARQNKRIVDKAVRQIDRERTKLQGNEGKLLEEIKKLAKKNQHVSILN